MKYAITGHSEGIGRHLFEKLLPNAVGFSRANGYDITDRTTRNRIIREVADCNVFINNAPAGFAQTEMFIELLEIWKNQEKTIINVGSRIAEIKLPPNRFDLLPYQSHKSVLKNMSLLTQDQYTCRIVYKSFGYVGTEKILAKYPNFTEQDYITVEQAVNVILS